MKSILNQAVTFSLSLGLAATTGCAEEEQPTASPNNRQQSVQTADATNHLLALSNASVAAGQIGQGQNFVFYLEGEIEAGVEEFMDSLIDEACADVEVTSSDDGESVHVAYSFDGCATALGLDDFSGDLNVDISATDDEVNLHFDCDDLDIDGTDLAGAWDIDLGADASAAFTGTVNIAVPGFDGIVATMSGDWTLLDGECPEVTQSIEIDGAEGSVSVNLDGVDLCNFSLCDSDLDIEVEDASGTTSVDFQNGEVSSDGVGVYIPCGDDDIPDWGAGDYGSDDLPDLEDLPGDP